jgi:predicted nucleic acid-binding Zn ribbon protein
MKPMPYDEALMDLTTKRDREQRRYHARQPKRISNVLAQLISKRGYGRVQTSELLADQWRIAVGEAGAKFSHACRVRRGNLEILVANSTVLQELTFQQHQILEKLQKQLPEAGIRALRFRSGPLPNSSH